MDLYYLNFNNYYNRQVKRFDTLAEYLPFLLGTAEANRNFNPANDITIKFITNRTRDQVGDYVIAVDNGDIISRWFILNGNRTRQGQYEITARRDVVADYYSQVITAPCFIEKAKLNNGDPMIFNKEDMTVNQIKTSETLLKDRTGCAWVVGYIPNNAFSDTQHDPYPYTIESKYISSSVNVDLEYDTLEDFPLNSYRSNNYYTRPKSMVFYTYVGDASESGILQQSGSTSRIQFLNLFTRASSSTVVNKAWTSSSGIYGPPKPAYIFYKDLIDSDFYNQGIYDYIVSQNLTRYVSGTGEITRETFMSYDGKIMRVGTSPNYVYYRINVVNKGDSANYPMDLTSYQATHVLGFCNLNGIAGSADSTTMDVHTVSDTYGIELTQIFDYAKVSIDATRAHLADSPYDMFCIPYSDELQIKKNGVNFCMSNKSLALSMATAIGEQGGSGTVYDVQLLPYCPVQRAIKANGDFDIVNESYDVITSSDGTQDLGVVIWCDSSNFTFDIENQINVTNPKVVNQCDKYRLVSPNYSGQFEFNVAMNRGMSKFNVDCTYKPFNPYIHINPDFNGLYGSDFDDARGLICGGDFSLPQVNNAWSTYQLQNKNYQLIFDRQIENMETNYYYQNMSQLISGSVNALSTGITTGVLAGAGFGVASGITSTAGMLTDYYINKQVQNEAIDYTKDLFGYNLGNIQALPESLTKVTAFNANNKLFPFLEYYTCTETERQAFENKIRWNGMTVMRIGTISEFIWDEEETYIKGQLIRLLDVDEPTNVLNEIANEINKGVFIDGRNTTSS